VVPGKGVVSPASCCFDEVEGTRLSSEQGTGVGASCCQRKRAQGLEWQWAFGRGFLNPCPLKEFASWTICSKRCFYLG